MKHHQFQEKRAAFNPFSVPLDTPRYDALEPNPRNPSPTEGVDGVDEVHLLEDPTPTATIIPTAIFMEKVKIFSGFEFIPWMATSWHERQMLNSECTKPNPEPTPNPNRNRNPDP